MAFVSGVGLGNGRRGVQVSGRRSAARRVLVVSKMALKVVQEKLPASQLALEITVPLEDTQRVYDKFVAGLVKRAEISGFRKGAAPKQLVINAAGKERIAASVVEELVEASVKEALEAEGISAVGQSSLESDVEELISSFSEKNPFVFKLKVDVWPTPTFNADWTSRTITVEEEPFNDDLVNEALEEFRKREATFTVAGADVPLEMGDSATANMVGYTQNEDGEKGGPLPDFADGEGVDIVLEEGKYMEGFVEGLVGGKAGETRAVKVQFPQTSRKELAGLKAIFDVEITEVKKRQLPELNDELAISAAGKKDLAELKQELRGRLNAEVEAANEVKNPVPNSDH